MGEMSHKLTPEQRKWAVEEYRRGRTPKQIADELSRRGFRVTGPAINYLVKKAGVERRFRPGIFPGTRRRFTLEQKREIVREYYCDPSRPSMRALAKKHGTTSSTVSAMVRLLGRPDEWCE